MMTRYDYEVCDVIVFLEVYGFNIIIVAVKIRIQLLLTR